jgi:hypothetical protein
VRLKFAFPFNEMEESRFGRAVLVQFSFSDKDLLYSALLWLGLEYRSGSQTGILEFWAKQATPHGCNFAVKNYICLGLVAQAMPRDNPLVIGPLPVWSAVTLKFIEARNDRVLKLSAKTAPPSIPHI